VTGVDLAETAVELARKNFAYHGVQGDLRVMDGEELAFEDSSFDVVYAHGVLQYTVDGRRMLAEIYRVLRPGGEAILMVYNRYSWLNLLSVLVGVALEHEDAPVLNKYSVRQFTGMLGDFSEVDVLCERFPVKTRLHGGLKGVLFNAAFVPVFNTIPKPLTKPTGWHILAKVKK
jgi:SAM-dependent methyltransferase